MICPVLPPSHGGRRCVGRSRSEIDEVRGGLRAHPSGWLEPGEAAGSGCLGAHLRRWRDRYEAEGADGLYDRRLAASRRGARRWTRWRGCWSCSTPATGTSSTSTRSWWPITASSAATTGCLSLQAQRRRGAQGGAHRRKRPRRSPGMMLHQGSSHEWVPGRWWDLRHHGRCDQRYLLGLLRRRRGHHVELPGGVRGDPGQGPVRSTPTAPATTGTRPRPAARWTRTPRPRSAAPWRSSASS